MKKIVILLLAFYTQFSFSQNLDLQLFATGLNRPVNIKHAGDDKLYVVEQDGIIKIINTDGTIEATPFLDIDPIVSSIGNEQGLLGLAFHPNYINNGFFFVNYINNSGNTVISRFMRSTGNPLVADVNSELILLTITQPFSNHNGGEMHFGPDGFLYISTGDGGSAGDPQNNSQNLGNLLGKILRIDVNNSSATNLYDIPADNPFFGSITAQNEIWSYGLRNPWKFSFDRSTGDLWIGDVGQNNREEINLTLASDAGGLNYGWRCYEGNLPFNTTGCPNTSSLIFPVGEYSHSSGRCSITGGYRYRGAAHPGLQGAYIYADACSQEIGFLQLENNNWNSTFISFSGNFVAFGEDQSGELYVSTLQGDIYSIIDTDSLGINDDKKDEFLIYPNPVDDTLFIEFSDHTTIRNIDINLFDIHGKRLNVQSKNEIHKLQLDVSNLTNGMYILVIQSENYGRITKKIAIK
ncbi:MAG: PQQ-dependent sugar dehydrogenase [Winogradskyella sp.]